MINIPGDQNPNTLAERLHYVIEANPNDHEEARIDDETVATAQALLETLQLDSTQNGAMLGNIQVTLTKNIPTGAVSVDFFTEKDHVISVDVNGKKITINGVETGITDVRGQITALGISLQ